MKNRGSEKVIEKYLVNKVAELDGWAIKLIPDQVKGLPDRLVLLPGGRVYFVELKSAGQKLRPLQDKIHKRLELMCFEVLVIDSIEKVDAFIYKVLENSIKDAETFLDSEDHLNLLDLIN